MKKIITIVLLVALCSNYTYILGQNKDTVSRKFKYGISFNNSWSTIVGSNLNQEYFYKPSLGTHLKVEYSFKPYFGIGVSGGIQQRGAGIKTIDTDKSLGNPDSLYRRRLRFNTLDFPLYLFVRTPKDIIKGVKLNFQIGANYHINFKTTDIFYSLEDGFHNRADVSSDYYKNSSFSLYSAIGFDIKAGNNIFQTHFIYNSGSTNVFNTSNNTSNAIGKNRLMGIQVAFLY